MGEGCPWPFFCACPCLPSTRIGRARHLHRHLCRADPPAPAPHPPILPAATRGASPGVSFPISRQGLEQIAIVVGVGLVLFGSLALLNARRGHPWRRTAASAGMLAGVAALALALAYTVAPNIPTPPVPLTARFAANPVPDDAASVAAGRARFLKSCVVCHGPEGKGDGPAAFTLQPRPVNLRCTFRSTRPARSISGSRTGSPGPPCHRGGTTSRIPSAGRSSAISRRSRRVKPDRTSHPGHRGRYSAAACGVIAAAGTCEKESRWDREAGVWSADP